VIEDWQLNVTADLTAVAKDCELDVLLANDKKESLVRRKAGWMK